MNENCDKNGYLAVEQKRNNLTVIDSAKAIQTYCIAASIINVLRLPMLISKFQLLGRGNKNF